MLLRFGFTTVFDTGSLFENTQALRLRIQRGEVTGPRILTTGEPLVAVNGTPYYLRPILLPELSSPAQATALTQRKLSLGADAIKLHTGAVTDREQGRRVAIAVDLVRAVSAEAHRQGKPVFAHPQSEDGLNAAIDGGVDVLAHVTEDLGAWPPAALSRARERRMALIPTLKLLAGMDTTPKQQGLLEQVRQYLGRGGQILFGTDVGFIPDEDPTEEYLLMQRAGMSWPAILAALTTEPASRFRPGVKAGRVAAGYEADLVVLEGDPARDLRSLSQVRYVVRDGLFVYKRPGGDAPAAGTVADRLGVLEAKSLRIVGHSDLGGHGTAVRDSPCAVMRRAGSADPVPVAGADVRWNSLGLFGDVLISPYR
jgi:imidazolonepropionase-like amidohydrolase